MSQNSLNLIKLIKNPKSKKDDIISFIRNNTFDINQLDSHGYNPLHYAIKLEKVDIVQILLFIEPKEKENDIQKSDPNIETKDIKNDIVTSPLLLTLMHIDDSFNCFKIIKLLIKAGANIDYKDEEGFNLFLRACEKGKVDVLEFLLKLTKNNDNEEEEEETKKEFLIDINKQVGKNGGGLHIGILSEKDNVINFLLENNIDLGIQDSEGNSVFHLALKQNQPNTFKILLDHITSNENLKDEDKKRILNLQNNEGNTILHEIVFLKSDILMKIIKNLPENISVDEEIKNKDNFTYKEVKENIIELEKKKQENEKKLKEEKRKQKELLKQQKFEEEQKIYEAQRKNKEYLEKQEEIGKKLIEYRGFIISGILIFFMCTLFLLVKNATNKKEKIL